MWPFNSVSKLNKSGILTNFTDWHSHILPGVDDGVKEMEHSLAILKYYEDQGIQRLWLTPHIMEDCPNTPEALRKRFAELKENYQGPIELNLAAENMLDNLFEQRLEEGNLLPIGKAGKHLLVETSYVNAPYAMDDMIENIFAAGYTPILAHPERYTYMDEDDYRKYKERGLLFQMNMMSSVGAYGETARRKAEWLLKEGMINFLGSDLHRLDFFDHFINLAPKKKGTLESMIEIARTPAIN